MRLRVNYFAILIGSALYSISTFVTLKIIKSNLGDAAYELYIVSLRYTSILVPLICFGMVISTIRSLTHKDQRNQYAVATSLITLLIMSALALKLASLKTVSDNISRILFGETNILMLMDLIILSIGMSFYGYGYCLYRAREKYIRAECVQLTILTIGIPLIAMFSANIDEFMNWAASTYGLAGALMILANTNLIKFGFSLPLMIFGFERMLLDLAIPFMLSIPVGMIAGNGEIGYAASLSFCIMIMNAGLMIVNPLSTMILPRAAKLLESKSDLPSYRNKILMVSVAVSLFVLFLTIICMEIVYGTVNYFLVITISFLTYFYALYVMCRSLIDGSLKPWYARKIIFISIIVEGLCLILFKTLNMNDSYVIICTIAGYAALATGSLRFIGDQINENKYI